MVAVAKKHVDERFVGWELKWTPIGNEMGIECLHRPVIREGLIKGLIKLLILKEMNFNEVIILSLLHHKNIYLQLAS